MLIHLLIHGSKKCHVNVTRLGQVLVEEEAMVFRSLHGFSFWNGFSWPWWSWWNILEYFRLDHIGSHDVTHHTSHTESYWVILSHTESYWVILSYQFISDITLHIISHPYRSTSLAKCTMWHHFSQTHAVPWLPMAENLDMRWSSSASGVARCWRCQRSRRQVQSFRVN